MSRAVVGIDPSLTGTGIATASKLQTVGTKAASSITGSLARIRLIEAAVLGLTAPQALAVIEAPAFSRANTGTHLGAGLWWTLVYALDVHGCTVVQVAPSSLKKFATGKGNATKSDMRMALYQRIGLDIADDNQVDAYFLRQIGLHLVGDPDALDLPKTQLAVVIALRGQLPAT